MNYWRRVLQILTVSPESWSKRYVCFLRDFRSCMLVIDNIRKGAGLANLKLRKEFLRRSCASVLCLFDCKHFIANSSLVVRELPQNARLFNSHFPNRVTFSCLTIADFFQSYFPTRLTSILLLDSQRTTQRRVLSVSMQ